MKIVTQKESEACPEGMQFMSRDGRGNASYRPVDAEIREAAEKVLGEGADIRIMSNGMVGLRNPKTGAYGRFVDIDNVKELKK